MLVFYYYVCLALFVLILSGLLYIHRRITFDSQPVDQIVQRELDTEEESHEEGQSTVSSGAYRRGKADCLHDYVNEAPFSSVGGIGNIQNLQRPGWITEYDWPEYRKGYVDQAKVLYNIK